jgi:hypothetical protein
MLTDPKAEALRRAVVGAAIKDHGPITSDRIGSAAKRILGTLRSASGARDRRAAVRSRYRIGAASRPGL